MLEKGQGWVQGFSFGWRREWPGQILFVFSKSSNRWTFLVDPEGFKKKKNPPLNLTMKGTSHLHPLLLPPPRKTTLKSPPETWGSKLARPLVCPYTWVWRVSSSSDPPLPHPADVGQDAGGLFTNTGSLLLRFVFSPTSVDPPVSFSSPHFPRCQVGS